MPVLPSDELVQLKVLLNETSEFIHNHFCDKFSHCGLCIRIRGALKLKIRGGTHGDLPKKSKKN